MDPQIESRETIFRNYTPFRDSHVNYVNVKKNEYEDNEGTFLEREVGTENNPASNSRERKENIQNLFYEDIYSNMNESNTEFFCYPRKNIDRNNDKNTNKITERKTDKKTDKKTDRNTDMNTDRNTDRNADYFSREKYALGVGRLSVSSRARGARIHPESILNGISNPLSNPSPNILSNPLSDPLSDSPSDPPSNHLSDTLSDTLSDNLSNTTLISELHLHSRYRFDKGLDIPFKMDSGWIRAPLALEETDRRPTPSAYLSREK